MKLNSYQNYVKMLNYGLSNDLITRDEAIGLLIEQMPLSFHRGEFAIPSINGVVVLRHRLCVWLPADGHYGLFDVEYYLA